MQQFRTQRMRIALIVGLVTALVGAVIAGIAFYDHTHVAMYDGFEEWETDEIVNADEIRITSIGDQVKRLRRLTLDALKAYYAPLNSPDDVASLSRFIAIIITFVTVLLTFRVLLIDRYAAEGQDVQLSVFSYSPSSQIQLGTALVIASVATLSTYLMQSASWILLANMFENMALSYSHSIMLTGLTVGGTGFMIAYISLAATTRDLFIFALLVVIIGFAGGFAIAGTIVTAPEIDTTTNALVCETGTLNQEAGTCITAWWQVAISRVGRSPNAELFFTSTFISFSLVMAVFWRSFSRILRIVLHETADPDKAQTIDATVNTIGVWLRGALVIFIIVGLVPFINNADTALGIRAITFLLHTVSTVVAISIFVGGGMGLLTYWMPETIFPLFFKLLSRALIGLVIIMTLAFLIGIITLTGLELALLGIVGFWIVQAVGYIFATVDELNEAWDCAPDSKVNNVIIQWQRAWIAITRR